jgi:dihydrofolate reductase
MAKLRVHNLSVSLDGYAAGPDQALAAPLGVGGERLHEWFFGTRTFQTLFGDGNGSEGVDEGFAARGDVGVGATIMGRNMFGPIRGDWGDEAWTGWWGDDPPYHHDVFVLTHHPRASIPMQGGTTFHFVTDGPEAALARAFDAAGGADVRIAGGAATIRQYLRLDLVDVLHVVVAPVLLGAGEPLLPGLGELAARYAVSEWVGTDAALHVVLTRDDADA